MVAHGPKHEWFARDDTVLATWRPHDRIPPHVWADRYRVLHREYGCAEPGPYRTRRTPYLAEVMDAIADPKIRVIAFTKSARIGGTEALGNMLAYAIDQDPGPILFVLPTKDMAEDECTKHLALLIQGTPRLAEHIPHAGWSTQHDLTLDTCTVEMAWAKAPRTLTAKTIRYVVIDEIDNCDRQSGVLGDTVALAKVRVKTYRDRGKVLLNSTPTTPEAGAWRAYQGSDRRHYFVPCPKCGAYQVLRFDQLKVPSEERDPDLIVHKDLAWYECEHCKATLTYREHQAWMVARGVWVAECQEIDQKLPVTDAGIVERAAFDHVDRWLPRITGTPSISRTAGFHIWAAYSPWVTWSEIMSEWFAVQATGDPEELRVFVNATLGEPFAQAAERLEVSEVAAKREGGLPRDIVPDEAVVLVASADVHKVSGINYAIVAFGYHRECWLIREGVVLTLEELHEQCTRSFERAGGGDPISPRMLAVDSGSRTREVYEFANTYPGVYAVKGASDRDPPWPFKVSHITHTRPNSTKQLIVQLLHVNTSTYKEMLHRMLHTADGEPGCVHLHRDTTDDFCQQLTAESLVWKNVTVRKVTRRVKVWEPKTAHTPNHYLDAMVYLLALADLRGVLTLQPPKPQSTTATSETAGRFKTTDGRPFLVTER